MTVRTPFETLARGHALPEFDLSITAPEVEAYLDATGEAPDRWRERVPPLMVAALILAGLLERVTIPPGVMHTGQEFEARRAVGHGEVLRVRIAVASHSARRGAVMAAFDAEASAGAEVVATSRTTVLVPPPGGSGEP